MKLLLRTLVVALALTVALPAVADKEKDGKKPAPKGRSKTTTNKKPPVVTPPGATAPSKPKAKTDTPLLTPVVVLKKNLSVDSVYKWIILTNPIETKFPDVVKTGVDAAHFDHQISEAMLNNPESLDLKVPKFTNKTPKSSLGYFDVHYEWGDSRRTDDLIAMKEAKFKAVGLITDFNTVLKLGPNDKTTADYNRLIKEGKWQDNEKAKEIQRLIKAGFKVYGNDAKVGDLLKGNKPFYGITSIPVHGTDGDKESEIMHQKEWAYSMWNAETQTWTPLFGMISEINYTRPSNAVIDPKTGISTPQGRLNTGRYIQDPDIIKNMIDHTMAMWDALGNGGDIKDIKSIAPIEVQFADGKIRLYYTDGRYNINNLDVEMWKDAIMNYIETNKLAVPDELQGYKATRKIKVRVRHFMNFVDTFVPGYQVEELYYSFDKEAEALTLIDNQFGTVNSYGLGAARSGFYLARPHGKGIRDTKGSLSHNPKVKNYLYQRMIPGLVQDDPTAAPEGVYLNHGKFAFTVVDIFDESTQTWKTVGILHDGSFNWSGHAANAESRLYHEIDEKTLLFQLSREMLPAIIAKELPEGFVVPGDVAVFRDILGEYTGHLFDEITLDEVHDLGNLIKDASMKKTPDEIKAAFMKVKEAVDKIYAKPTRIKKKVSQELYDARNARFKEAIDAYATFPVIPSKDPQRDFGNGLNVYRLVSLAMKILNPEQTQGQVADELNFALWRPGMETADVQNRVNTMMKVLGYDQLPKESPMEKFDPDNGGFSFAETDTKPTLRTRAVHSDEAILLAPSKAKANAPVQRPAAKSGSVDGSSKKSSPKCSKLGKVTPRKKKAS